MKVYRVKPKVVSGTDPPQIMLEPETAHDRLVLEWIIQECDRLVGYGRDPRDGELVHVSILLIGE